MRACMQTCWKRPIRISLASPDPTPPSRDRQPLTGVTSLSRSGRFCDRNGKISGNSAQALAKLKVFRLPHFDFHALQDPVAWMQDDPVARLKPAPNNVPDDVKSNIL